jgi:hypothetical protein
MKKGLQGIDAHGGAAYKPAIRGSDGPEIIGVGGPRKGMPVGRKPEDNALRRAEARKVGTGFRISRKPQQTKEISGDETHLCQAQD